MAGKFNKIEPKTKQEILDTAPEKFLLKFGADFCGPCRQLKAFMDSGEYSPPKDITVYLLQTDDRGNEFPKTFAKDFQCRAVPHCIVVDKSFKKIDEMIGYSDKNDFIKFIEKNFK